MIAKLIISDTLQSRQEFIINQLSAQGLSLQHPDVLYLSEQEKLGVAAAKKIREFLSLKPYQAKGRAVVIMSAQDLTTDAQNSLLKTLEEPPQEAIILLAANSDKTLLPTITSRCVITFLETSKHSEIESFDDIRELLAQDVISRFGLIEKADDKTKLLLRLIHFYRTESYKNPNKNLPLLKIIMDADRWKNTQGNERAILEYLMLKLPKI